MSIDKLYSMLETNQQPPPTHHKAAKLLNESFL